MNKLELQDLTVRYGVGRNALTAVDGVSVSLPQRRTLGLVGESGCGKSRIARAVVGLAPVISGKVLLDGEDFTARSRRESLASP